MWGSVGVGILMSVLFLVFMDPILGAIGASADTWDYAKIYLVIVRCLGPFVLIASCFSNVVRAVGCSTQAMMGQLIGNLFNVILDPIMILVFGWNIAGAAIVTLIGNVVGGRATTSSTSVHLEREAKGFFGLASCCVRGAGHRHSGGAWQPSHEPLQHHHE